MSLKVAIHLILVFLYIFPGCTFPIHKVNAKEVTLKKLTISGSKITLFANTGKGDYYTFYPEGIIKEKANIGGFKSAQLDPLKENIYFYDPVLKVIAKINLKDNKVYKVIGKPKSNIDINYSNPVNFNDASLGKLIGFSFDRYGNIFILDSGNSSGRLLKASFKDNSIKEILNVNNYFLPASLSNTTFTLSGISYDHDRHLYIIGSLTGKGPVVLKFDPLTKTGDMYAGGSEIKNLGYEPKVEISNSSQYTIQGLTFGKNNTCYLSNKDYQNSRWSYFTQKLIQNENTVTKETFIGDGSGGPNDIGDGGSVKSAYAGLFGARCICGDKNGDILIADSINNRIRKIFANSDLIATVAGGGADSVSFNESKTPESVSLEAPNTLLVDKANNLYIVEDKRILVANNLITHDENASQTAKVANLAITKIADKEIKDPKGLVELPDLSFDYTYAGDQTIEVKGENIPNGTNIKLVNVNLDGTTTLTPNTGKLEGSIAKILTKIDAGTTRVIKAETDPFIPAPGVYLPGTEPQTIAGELPSEPQIATTNRDIVNATGNLLPQTVRFNFKHGSGWQRSDNDAYALYKSKTKLNAAVDPDNAIADATFLDIESWSGSKNTVIFDTKSTTNNKPVTFSIWMRTDSGNVSFPFGIGPNCSGNNAYCEYPTYVAYNYPQYIPELTYNTVTVTPTWQKFSITSNSNINTLQKAIYIGGFTDQEKQKVYIWGARLEAASN